MNLKSLYEGYWEVVYGYPNALLQPKKKKRLSFLIEPNDRQRFINWMHGNSQKRKK